ncbi:MarR family winged helix-turn-helix transcriptional regulator [Kitasatospora sp. NBC_01300]|uniref:MarR family winged helix-turn-helix transcriptional regulator n=1 Tax=Kitasatospora sp. NBC_01300 TaxID=2903574 RepID=UPI00352E9A51|nr:MarR family winged helix-turn-helix transcriptional regulator [Kitasatospora sp. NBC_01300]
MDETQAVWQLWVQSRPDLDLSSMEIIGGLRHAHAMLEFLLEPVFEAAAVSSSEFDVLYHLRHSTEPTIARRLAASMGRSPAALSKALAKLERRALVVRTVNPADRRAALVFITDAGAAAVDDVMPKRLAIEQQVLGALSDGQSTQVRIALQRLAEAIEAQALRSPPAGPESTATPAWSPPRSPSRESPSRPPRAPRRQLANAKHPRSGYPTEL